MIAAVAIDTNAYSSFRSGRPELVEVFNRVPRLIVPLGVIADLLAGFRGAQEGGAFEARRTNEAGPAATRPVCSTSA